MSSGQEPVDLAVACTLGASELHDRLTEWDRVLTGASRRSALASGGVRIEFEPDVDIGRLAGLTVAEQSCCAFFEFSITVDVRGIGLEVGAPADALDLVRDMFGMPSSSAT